MDKTVVLMVMFVLSLAKFGFTEGQDGVTFTVSPQAAIPDKAVYLACIADGFDTHKDGVEITFKSADDTNNVYIFFEGTIDPIGIRPPDYYSFSTHTEINRFTLNITIHAIQGNDIGLYLCIVRRDKRQLVSKEINLAMCEQVSPPSCFLSEISSCSTARGMPVCTASKGEIKKFVCIPDTGFDLELNTLEWIERGMNGNEAFLTSYMVNSSTILNYTFLNNVTLKCNTNIQNCGGYSLSCSIGIIVSSDPTKSSPIDGVTRNTTTLEPFTSSMSVMSTVTITAEDQQQFPLVMVVGIGGGALGIFIIIVLVICLLRLKPVKGNYGKQDNVIMAFVPDASSKETDMPSVIPSYENCPTNDEISQAETNMAVDIANESEPFYENEQVTDEECHTNIESQPIYDPVNIENDNSAILNGSTPIYAISKKESHPSGKQPMYAAVDKTNRSKQSKNDSVPDTLLENESDTSSLPVYAVVHKDQKDTYKPLQEEPRCIDSPMPSYAQVDKKRDYKNYSAESEYATPADLDVKRAINYAMDDLANSTSAAKTKVHASDTALYSSVQ